MKMIRFNFYFGIIKGLKYKDAKPNFVHKWLSDKKLITQNIDGLDFKAGNLDYIPIHGRLDKLIKYDNEFTSQEPIDANWENIDNTLKDDELSLALIKNLKYHLLMVSQSLN